MVTNNLKNYNTDEIIAIIDDIQDGSIPYNLNDLKSIFSEATNRKLDKIYIDILGNLIKQQLKNENSTTNVQNNPKIRQTDYTEQEVYDDDKFPILSFIVSLYKVIAWFLMLLSVGVALFFSISMFLNNIAMIALIMLGGFGAGTVFILVFYAMAENILLKLEIEKHLRKR